MDRVKEVMNVCKIDISDDERMILLSEMLVDLKNEMEAQDQNFNINL